jgi:AAA15 family ATPase/GTPase
MLDHLHIQNYRLFRDLHIDKLGQVNLIAGKNNTGKTALLEAIRILLIATDNYQTNDEISLAIISRGDDEASDLFETLFNNAKLDILINNIQITGNKDYKIVITHSEFNDDLDLKNRPRYLSFSNIPNERINDQFTSVSINTNGKLNDLFWREIALTPEEDDVVEILKIIDGKIRKINVNSGRAKVLLSGSKKPIPLKNLGDGANRLLTLALALVNAKDKVLLIDEFEVGLHHSIQEQLWDAVFKYAKKWNIQVFVTTHSQDTVQSFYYVANKTPQYKSMANYFTLNRKEDNDVKAINYDLDEIETALLANLEIR